MKTILVMMDSLNRHMLSVYNQTWVKTPNIDRLAQRSVVFDNHWLGSAPCMPARRDMFTGRLNFLERNWGAIEPFDVTLPEKLKEKGVFTHIITDHYHYFEIGGENYCQLFDTWDLHRGQESDPWVSRVKPPEKPDRYYGQVREQYELNRTRFKKEEDYSGPKTFAAACQWLEDNKDAEEFFLWVEAFDPHEPFDAPDEYIQLYNDDYDGPRYDWPAYTPVSEPDGATRHLRKRYAAGLTMIDNWLGKMLDVLDKHNMWEDTLLIFTTDHGHMLGEHGFLAKNYMHVYNELAHIPLIIHLPGGRRAGERVDALTQNIDLMPTILDYLNIGIPERVQGHSLKGILEGKESRVRDVVLYGYHGMAVNMMDGRYTYFRAPASEDNYPCYMYTAMPTTFRRYIGRDKADEIEAGRFLKHTNYPVFKIPVTYKGQQCNNIRFVKDSLIFDLQVDYKQENPIKDPALEKALVEKLTRAMKDFDAPDEQFKRLGLVPDSI